MITTSIILITIAAVLLIAYTVALCVNNGIPRSLSASVFFLPRKGAWLWTAVIAAVALALAPVLIGTATAPSSSPFSPVQACSSWRAVHW